MNLKDLSQCLMNMTLNEYCEKINKKRKNKREQQNSVVVEGQEWFFFILCLPEGQWQGF